MANNPLNLTVSENPVIQFIVNGGSWGDAMILDASLNIPILEARLRAAARKRNPPGERYRAILLNELIEAYIYVGKTRAEAEAFLAKALANTER